MIKRIISVVCVALAAVTGASAQTYLGTSGLLYTPTAFTAEAGHFSVGANYHDSHAVWNDYNTPENIYNSGQFHLGVSVFSWMEMAYSFHLKNYKGLVGPQVAQYDKDQMFNVKFRLLNEGKWHPCVAIGANDVFTSVNPEGNQYQGCLYGALSKTLMLRREKLQISVAYRRYLHADNARWQGVVGGVAYIPSFAPWARAMAEWTGNEINLGLHALVWNHFLLQASLLNGRWPSAGIAFTGSLL